MRLIMNICMWLLCSSFYPINLSFLSVKGCKRMKEGRKETMIPFNWKLYFGVHDSSVTSRFFEDLAYCQNLRGCASISSDTVLIFPKNFHNVESDMIEALGIINHCFNSSKSYVSVVLSGFRFCLSWRCEGYATFHGFIECVLFIDCIA